MSSKETTNKWEDDFLGLQTRGINSNPLYEMIVNKKDAINFIRRLLAEKEREKEEIINRVEVIDHTLPVEKGGGRAYVKWEDGINVSTKIQDDGRTLKIFITKLKQKG